MNTGPLPPPLPCSAVNYENTDTEFPDDPAISALRETVTNCYNGLWGGNVPTQTLYNILHFIVIILDTKTRWIVVNEW